MPECAKVGGKIGAVVVVVNPELKPEAIQYFLVAINAQLFRRAEL
jgi:acyl-coenzyme A synthetase/AMP-(fatty) acid ligase